MSKIIKIPAVGRFAVVKDAPQGQGGILASQSFQTNLKVEVYRNGRPLKSKDTMKLWSRFWGGIKGEDSLIDLGSGLVTNIGVLSMANDPAWSAQLNLATLALANNHASGTGTTAAAATDFKLQTASTNGGQTPVAGTQTLVTSGTAPQYKTVVTINYTGSEAVTEWGLFSQTSLSSTTGTPFTATSATSWTDTGSAQTASSATVRGLQGTIVVPGTTAVWGLNLSNTTHVGTISAWYNQSNGAAGSTPGSTEAFTIRPVMWDHKVFSAINVVNGDSIQYTYSLTVNSGG